MAPARRVPRAACCSTKLRHTALLPCAASHCAAPLRCSTALLSWTSCLLPASHPPCLPPPCLQTPCLHSLILLLQPIYHGKDLWRGLSIDNQPANVETIIADRMLRDWDTTRDILAAQFDPSLLSNSSRRSALRGARKLAREHHGRASMFQAEGRGVRNRVEAMAREVGSAGMTKLMRVGRTSTAPRTPQRAYNHAQRRTTITKTQLRVPSREERIKARAVGKRTGKTRGEARGDELRLELPVGKGRGGEPADSSVRSQRLTVGKRAGGKGRGGKHSGRLGPEVALGAPGASSEPTAGPMAGAAPGITMASEKRQSAERSGPGNE